MSGTFPASLAPAALEIWSFQPTRLSVAHSLKTNARTTNAHRWRMRLGFASAVRADLVPIRNFLEKQRGRFDTFQIVLPNPLHTPRGAGAVGSPSPFVDGSQVSPTNDIQLGRTILTGGWTPNTLILMEDDFFKFASHSKVYCATDDITSAAAGTATLEMNPAAVQALSHGDAIVTGNVPFTVRRTEDETPRIRVAPGGIFTLDDFELVEDY